MRKRLALLATASLMVPVLALVRAHGQQQSGRAASRALCNPTVAQQPNERPAETETIRGVVAGVTAEGEMVFDYKSNRGAAAEAACLTVVG